MCKSCPNVPVARKCCFFVPIRRGVAIFGYVNLVLTLLSFPVLIFMLVERVTEGRGDEEVGPDPLIHMALTVVFGVLDVALITLLLLGVHKKKNCLLRIYLYLGVTLQVISIFTDCLFLDSTYTLDYITNAIYFVIVGLNIYLFYLVYNTIRVIEESREVQYVVYQGNQLRNDL